MRTNQVAVAVVDLLEVVQIQEESRDTLTVTPGSPDLIQKELAHVTRVVKLGQIVCL